MSTNEIRSVAMAVFILAGATTAWAADEPTSTVEKCSKSFGVLAVSEPQHGWGHLRGYGLGSPAALLRMMIQQSGCFDVAERGVAMQNLQQERAMAEPAAEPAPRAPKRNVEPQRPSGEQRKEPTNKTRSEPTAPIDAGSADSGEWNGPVPGFLGVSALA